MSAMRIGLLLCLFLVVAVAGEAEPVIDGRVIRFANGDSAILPFWTIEVKPRPLYVPEVEYPEAARKARIEGLVVVEALVDADGTVANVRVLKTSGNAELHQAAVAAASRATFAPASSRDRPALKWVTIPYRFALKSGKGIALVHSISLVTFETVGPPAGGKNHSDSVLEPLRGLKFVRLKPIAPRTGAHGRLVPDSAAIRFNNEAMMAACTAYSHSRGDSLRRPASYYLQSDWYDLVIDRGRSRVFQRNHPHYPSSRAEVYDVDTLMVKPAGLDTHYVEMPGWTALPRYVPLKLELVTNWRSRFLQAPTFAPEVQ